MPNFRQKATNCAALHYVGFTHVHLKKFFLVEKTRIYCLTKNISLNQITQFTISESVDFTEFLPKTAQHTVYCGNYWISLSRIFGNTKELIWRNIFLVKENFSFFHTTLGNLLSRFLAKVSWKQWRNCIIDGMVWRIFFSSKFLVFPLWI